MYSLYNKEIFINKLNIFLIFVLLVLLDQTSKVMVTSFMIENGLNNISIFPFFDLVFVRNTGISFGLFSEGGQFNRYFFSLLSISIGTLLIIFSFFAKKKVIIYAFTFTSAGAIGNASDRVYFGGVIDFIDLFIYNMHWPAFNLADVFITIGVFFLLYESFFQKK